MYAKVENGAVAEVEDELPTSGVITVDGEERSVSNFHLLDAEVLRAEGWLPVDLDTKRPRDTPGKRVVEDGFEVLKTKVNRTYRVEDVPPAPPEPAPPTDEELQARIDALSTELERISAELQSRATALRDR